MLKRQVHTIPCLQTLLLRVCTYSSQAALFQRAALECLHVVCLATHGLGDVLRNPFKRPPHRKAHLGQTLVDKSLSINDLATDKIEVDRA